MRTLRNLALGALAVATLLIALISGPVEGGPSPAPAAPTTGR